MIDNNLYIKLFANCIPVKGAKRSAIYDLQRNEIKLIPNDLYNILIAETIKIGEIKSKFNNEFDETIDEYFIFLIEHEFAFITKTPEIFPDLSKNWYEPAEINNAIFDISKESSYNITTAFEQLDVLNCKNVQLRFFRRIEIEEITTLLDFLDKQKSFITSVDFIFPFIDAPKILDRYTTLIEKYKRINSLTIYNSKVDKFFESKRHTKSGYIVLVTEKVTSSNHCGIISPEFFSINIKTYTEGFTNNTCLNKKISIDVNGDIKNCPSMSKNFGNIENTSFQQALKVKDFKKYWNVSKDKIEVCKDCEFRYICTDCRAYKEDPDNDFSKPLKCGYSPYTNQWEDWSKNPLKAKAIKYYGMSHLMNTND